MPMANSVFLRSCHVLFKFFWLFSIHCLRRKSTFLMFKSQDSLVHIFTQNLPSFISYGSFSIYIYQTTKQLFFSPLSMSDAMNASIHAVPSLQNGFLPWNLLLQSQSFKNQCKLPLLRMEQSPNIALRTEPIAFLNYSYMQSRAYLFYYNVSLHI